LLCYSTAGATAPGAASFGPGGVAAQVVHLRFSESANGEARIGQFAVKLP